MGGKQIPVVFRSRPDRAFDAWVYRLGGGGYDLRGFSEADIDREGLKGFIDQCKGLVFDDPHAL